MSSTTALFPPRPYAIATILESNDDLKKVQILLYSIIKKSLTKSTTATTTNDNNNEVVPPYAPELLLLTTQDCIGTIKENRLDVLCDRVIILESSSSTIPFKIELFKLTEYERIFFIDCSCVVVRDITHLLKNPFHNNNILSAVLNSSSSDSTTNKVFSTNVLLLKPCASTYQSLYSHNSSNASNVMLTHKVDETLAQYFASSFTTLSKTVCNDDIKDATTAKLTLILSHPSKTLQNQHYSKCETYKESLVKSRAIIEQKYEEKKRKAEANATKRPTHNNSTASKPSTELKQKHDSVSVRYKKLRKEGLSLKEAMLQARRDCGDDTTNDISNDDGRESGKKVAQMFGLNL